MDDGEGAGGRGFVDGALQLNLHLAPARAAHGGPSASIPASSNEIGSGDCAVMISGMSEVEWCVQFVRGWSPYIGSTRVCREVTDDDHGGDVTASCGHGRGWHSVHGVTAGVTVVLAQRAVVKHSGADHARVIVSVDGRRGARLL